MAKVKTPLLSLRGTGTVGKQVSFYEHGPTHCAREYVVPADADTAAQQTMRDAMSDINTAWTDTFRTDQNRTAWNLYRSVYRAPGTGYSNFISNAIKSYPDSQYRWFAVEANLINATRVDIPMARVDGLPPAGGRHNMWIFASTTPTDLRFFQKKRMEADRTLIVSGLNDFQPVVYLQIYRRGTSRSGIYRMQLV